MISSKKKIFTLLLLAVLIVLVVSNLLKSSPEKIYTNTVYGFSFSYPKNYVVVETESNSNTEIILVDKKESEMANRSEGPVSISVVVYKNASNISLRDWLQSNESNFKLAIGPESFTTVAEQEAVQYEWDGLYRGRTITFSLGDKIIALSGTYLEKTDRIYSDFESVVQSFSLDENSILKIALLKYLETNISKLSPEKEVLGGTFYITELIVVDNKHATVSYEDGHNAYTAKLQFTVNENQVVDIESFEVVGI
jgi:hypothetical protein